MNSPFKVDPTQISFRMHAEVDNEGIDKDFIFTSDRSCMDPVYQYACRIPESTNFSVVLETDNPNDELYIDDFNETVRDADVDHRDFPTDGKGYRYSPNRIGSSERYKCSVKIFNRGRNDPYYTLSPGMYGLSVISNGRRYYCSIEITLKNLISDSSWINMEQDIDEKISQLSRSSVKNYNMKFAVTDQRRKQDPQDEAAADDLIQNSKQLTANLQKLPEILRFQIRKDYKWKDNKKSIRTDAKSLKMMTRYPEKTAKESFSRYNALDYDIKANQYIKFSIEYLARFVNKRIDYYQNILKNELDLIKNNSIQNDGYLFKNEKEELTQKVKQLTHIRAVANQTIRNKVFKNVKSKFPNSIPKTIILNPVYRNIFNQYENVRVKKYQLSLTETNRINWKPTHEIYEIWSCLTLVDLFLSDGYKIVEDWDLGNRYDSIQRFTDGANITIENPEKNYLLKITYNQRIENNSVPNFTASSKHNYPDIRMDIRVKDNYVGSIILDTKYRSIYQVVLGKKLNESTEENGSSKYEKGSSNLGQLISYKDFIRNKKFDSEEKTVISVYALLPDIPKKVWGRLKGKMDWVAKKEDVFIKPFKRTNVVDSISSEDRVEGHNIIECINTAIDGRVKSLKKN